MIRIPLNYRLQPLLELKLRARKKAEILLARAIGRLEQEKARLEKLKEEKKKIIEERKKARKELYQTMSTGRARVKDGSSRVNFLKKLEEDEKVKDQEIENQKRVIVECETQVKRARRDYINAAKELQIMEKHKGLWQKKLHLFLSRKEEGEMDELGNIIHQLRGFQVRTEGENRFGREAH
jgi:flagellar export protein FliJ